MAEAHKLVPCTVKLAKFIKKSGCDVLCVIDKQIPSELVDQFNEFRAFDKAFDSVVSCFKSQNLDLPVVYSPIAELNDYHDVRAYQQAAAKSLSRAIKAGFQSPLLLVPQSKIFSNAELCTVLGALEELYVPIQLREDVPEKKQRITNLSLMISNPKAEQIYKEALLLESGRFVARDIGVGDPERMCPTNVEQYIKTIFPSLKMDIISDIDVLTKEYPLFAAVNRAASTVKRHQGRIIFLEYKPPQPAKKTLMLVGKGVCYDTGGADIKAGGIMAGMSRDKCGAAAVAGFMQIVQEQKPADVNVIAALCLVRNSVGEESYVADEVITSRAGVRVRVGNTDAEGRMCMADALCRMKEIANERNLPDPHLFTIATLTGHACLAVGEGYSIVIDNSVAQQAGHALKLQEIGTSFGEPFEISKLRHDDFDFNCGKVIGEDIVQCNNAASSRTPRGHQVPAAFMIVTTGLEKHGLQSEKPLKYTHLDIAASAGEYPKMPTGIPVIALAKTHL
ncbi:putative aminopeptidase W07G4.4 isoform X2 [Episyrphus balteatus]|uniref:putative aminopeptidase W07G4.4 isoform X2 n=1 Tax=Episyrphus balteatus TaxID=286459 RepID=UPI00248536D8|nr:putative aminopeptidase W07G4.4 isoform X2 [Episyrphus balteatus]